MRTTLALAIALLFRACTGIPAYAQTVPPHTIDMNFTLLEEDGKPVQDCDQAPAPPAPPAPPNCVPLTLGRAASHALLFGRYPGEEGLSGDVKWARGTLAERIRTDGKATLTAEEIGVVKRLIGKYYSPVIIAQAYPMLDPNAKPGPLQ